MPKIILTINIVLLFWSNCFAQKRIAIEIAVGANYNLNSYNPTEAITTSVSKVENKRYISPNNVIVAHYAITNNLSIGAGVGWQGFSWGWEPENHYSASGVGISSGGRFSSNDLYFIQASAKYYFSKKRRFNFYHSIAINLLKYTINDYLKDTTVVNNFFRGKHPERNEILYKALPIKDKEGIYPLLVYTLGAEVNLGKWFYLTSRVGTQIGFKNLYKQEVEINRQWQGKSYTYTTKHNGSSLTYHFGIGIRL